MWALSLEEFGKKNVLKLFEHIYKLRLRLFRNQSLITNITELN